MNKEEVFIAGGDWDFWDKEEVIIDDSETRTQYGKLRVFLNLQVRRFQKGLHVELPGILNYPFDESTQTSSPPTGPFQLKGMALGSSSNYLNIVVAEMKNKDQVVYQRKPLISRNWRETDDDGNKRPNIWNDYQKAEFFKLPQADRKMLGDTGKIAFSDPNDPKAWVYAKWDFLPTGYTYQWDPKSYYGNITVFASEELMEKAEQEWRSQFSNSDNQEEEDFSHYPKIWQNKPEALAKFAKKKSGDGLSYKDIAIACHLLEDGIPVESANGDKVNVVALLAELLDVPEPVVTLE